MEESGLMSSFIEKCNKIIFKSLRIEMISPPSNIFCLWANGVFIVIKDFKPLLGKFSWVHVTIIYLLGILQEKFSNIKLKLSLEEEDVCMVPCYIWIEFCLIVILYGLLSSFFSEEADRIR